MLKSWKIFATGLFVSLNITAAFAMYGPDSYKNNIGQIYSRIDFGYNLFNTPSATTVSSSSSAKIYASNEQVSDHVGYNIGFGYKYSEPIRGDVTLTYRAPFSIQLVDDYPQVGRGALANYTFMVNGYYDFQWNLPVDIYAMAGIGVSVNTTKNLVWPYSGVVETGQTLTNFAWQIGPGVAYQVNNTFYVDFNYQFVSLGPFSNLGEYSGAGYYTPTRWGNLYSNQLQLGLRAYII